MTNKIARLLLRLAVYDGPEVTIDEDLFPAERFSTAVLKQESVTINAATFQALSPPANAKALVIQLGTAESITLKGITGDTGVKLTPAANPLGLPAVIPLGNSPSIGLLNGDGSAVTIDLIWL